jgi:hypothetical protein
LLLEERGLQFVTSSLAKKNDAVALQEKESNSRKLPPNSKGSQLETMVKPSNINKGPVAKMMSEPSLVDCNCGATVAFETSATVSQSILKSEQLYSECISVNDDGFLVTLTDQEIRPHDSDSLMNGRNMHMSLMEASGDTRESESIATLSSSTDIVPEQLSKPSSKHHAAKSMHTSGSCASQWFVCDDPRKQVRNIVFQVKCLNVIGSVWVDLPSF